MNLSVDELISSAHQNAANKGFWPELETWKGGDVAAFQQHINLPRRLMLVFTEIAEAWAARGVQNEGHWIDDHMTMSKPEGYESELADILIRMADICGGYMAAGFTPTEWIPLNPVPGSIEASIQQIDNNEPLTTEMGLVIAQACEYDRKGGLSALPVLYHGLKHTLLSDKYLHDHIRQKMDYNATRPTKHGKTY